MFLESEKQIFRKFKEDVGEVEKRLEEELARIGKEDEKLMINLQSSTFRYDHYCIYLDEVRSLKRKINSFIEEFSNFE